jgi:hypothetical protein
MSKDSFDSTYDNIKNLLYKNVIFTKVNADYDVVSMKLESLFSGGQSFQEFRKAYDKVIENINIYPPYPRHYYNSISYTWRCLFNVKSEEYYLSRVLDNFSKKNTKIKIDKEIYNLISKGFLLEYEDLMAKLFFELSKFNLIDISAIPHILRRNSQIKSLFKTYGFANILPRKKLNYDIYKRYRATLKNVDLTRNIKLQIINNNVHRYSLNLYVEGFGDVGNMTNYSDEELNSILYGYYYSLNGFVNFFDENDIELYPYELIRTSKESEKNFYLFSKGEEAPYSLFDKDCIEIKIPKAEKIKFYEPKIFGIYNSITKNYIIKFEDDFRSFKEYKTNTSPIWNRFNFYEELNAYFLANGWISLSGEMLTPLCFTDCGNLSEDMMAFEMNGNWGYMDKQFRIIIQPIYSQASEFKDGFAKVCIPENTYTDNSEEWLKVPSWIPIEEIVTYNLNEELFKQKFPDFPEYYWYNFKKSKVVELDPFTEEENEIVNTKNGIYAKINKKGEIVSLDVEIFKNDNIDFELIKPKIKLDEESMFLINDLPREYLYLIEKYDYSNYTPDKRYIEKVLTNEEKDALYSQMSNAKKHFLTYRDLPASVIGDINFIIRLVETDGLTLYNTPLCLLYNEQYLASALKNKKLNYIQLPAIFNDRFEEFKENDDDLPF